jgi:hypothetical protein
LDDAADFQRSNWRRHLGCRTVATRFSCWDGQRSIKEGSYEYFNDNTLKECENPVGNGFAVGL